MCQKVIPDKKKWVKASTNWRRPAADDHGFVTVKIQGGGTKEYYFYECTTQSNHILKHHHENLGKLLAQNGLWIGPESAQTLIPTSQV